MASPGARAERNHATTAGLAAAADVHGFRATLILWAMSRRLCPMTCYARCAI